MVEATAAARSRIDPSHIFTIDTSIDTAEFFELDVRDAAKTHTVVEGPEDPQASAEASISAAIGDSTAIDCSSVDASTKATAATPLDDVDHLKAVNMTNHGTPHVRGHSSWRTLLLEVDSDRTIVEEDTKLDQARIAVYAMTSGTTGLPKAAAIAHRSIVAQTALLEDQFSTRPYQVLSPILPRKLKEPRLTPITAVTTHLPACLSCFCITPGPGLATPTRHSDVLSAKMVSSGVFASRPSIRHN